MTWKTKQLRRPIMSFGVQITELVLREPGMSEVNDIKAYPYTVCPDEDGGVEIRIKPLLVGKYIQALADVPAGAVKEMHPADVFEIGNELMGFFMGGSQDEAASAS